MHAVKTCLSFALLAANFAGAKQPINDSPAQSPSAVAWNQPQAAQRIFGNTYYVGMAGLSSVLISTDAGLILLDGDLETSADMIEAHVRDLGFALHDVKYILNSHAHFDHAGGIAKLQRDSGATVLASPNGAAALYAGHALGDDPQAGYAANSGFPRVASVETIGDGQTLLLGETIVTAHFTPGHTRGSTSWTWQSCEGQRCLNIVYADSLNAIAAPGYHYLADRSHADLSGRFRASIQTIANLPCDILVTVHPDLSGIPEKLRLLHDGVTPNPFIDPGACRTYAATASTLLEQRLQTERAMASGSK